MARMFDLRLDDLIDLERYPLDALDSRTDSGMPCSG